MRQPAYTILAHKRPDLLARLVGALGDAPIAVHVDAKSDMSTHEIDRRPNVTMLDRRKCYWGLYPIVDAALSALPWFLKTNASHLILLSGQCYPLVSQDQVARHLTELGERSQMRMMPFPIAKWGPTGGYNRLDRFYFRGRRTKPASLKLLPRSIPAGLHPHGGSQFWCLSRRHAAYLRGYMADHQEVARFFSSTLIPDEVMPQTILANSPHAAEVNNTPLTYTSFAPGAANPKILGLEDLPGAWASGSLFARKFEDHAVLDRLDDRIADHQLAQTA